MGTHRRMQACAALAVLAASLAAAPAQAQDAGCVPQGMSGQCNELGVIVTEFQRDVKGEPVEVSTHITVHSAYREREVRSFLFSVRNTTTDRASPVQLELLDFRTAEGPVAVLKRDDPGPHEIDLWVDVLDIPVGQQITLTVRATPRDKGAFKLETLVMPFDRAFHPLAAQGGGDLSLFAFTLLAVNDPVTGTGAAGKGVFGERSLGKKLPAPDAALAAAAVGATALALASRKPPGPGARTALQVFRRP